MFIIERMLHTINMKTYKNKIKTKFHLSIIIGKNKESDTQPHL